MNKHGVLLQTILKRYLQSDLNLNVFLFLMTYVLQLYLYLNIDFTYRYASDPAETIRISSLHIHKTTLMNLICCMRRPMANIIKAGPLKNWAPIRSEKYE